MAEPSLTEIFGNGVTQDATTLTIPKVNLPGLTASSNNTAESLLVGLLLRWASSLTEAAQEANPDQQITVVESGFPATISRNNTFYKQITYNINLQKEEPQNAIDPDDY